MKNKVQVLLLEAVESLGATGDIVEVTEGYARNFLFPEGKAALATKQVQEKSKHEQKKIKQKTEENLQALQEQAESLEGTELSIKARVTEGEELYGSITAAHIAKEINEQAHLGLKAKNVNVPKPLRQAGNYDITIELSPEVETHIKLSIVPENSPHDRDEET